MQRLEHPLFRNFIGLDRLASAVEGHTAFPPYDLEKIGEDGYRLTLAVAGFKPEAVSITTQEGVLTIEGQRQDGEEPRTFLHRGLAGRNFRRLFSVSPEIKVESAEMREGLLIIDLKREVPEAHRLKQISIRSAS